MQVSRELNNTFHCITNASRAFVFGMRIIFILISRVVLIFFLLLFFVIILQGLTEASSTTSISRYITFATHLLYKPHKTSKRYRVTANKMPSVMVTACINRNAIVVRRILQPSMSSFKLHTVDTSSCSVGQQIA